jgi:hypothetical protein
MVVPDRVARSAPFSECADSRVLCLSKHAAEATISMPMPGRYSNIIQIELANLGAVPARPPHYPGSWAYETEPDHRVYAGRYFISPVPEDKVFQVRHLLEWDIDPFQMHVALDNGRIEPVYRTDGDGGWPTYQHAEDALLLALASGRIEVRDAGDFMPRRWRPYLGVLPIGPARRSRGVVDRLAAELST